MPSPLQTSFASAAAGNTQDASRRGDSSAPGEWARSRVNGATTTFRRPSGATNPAHNRDSASNTSASSPFAWSNVPTAPRSSRVGDSRYTKDQLLNIYKDQKDSGSLVKQIADYFIADWDPINGSSGHGSWAKREDDNNKHVAPEVCWDHSGQIDPMGLKEMDPEEKEIFSTSVNSPLKAPPLIGVKDGAGGAKRVNSHTQSMNPLSPGIRRRGTNDSVGNTASMSPTASRFFRGGDDSSNPPPSVMRRKTDFKDDGKAEEKGDLSSPFSSLKRGTINPVTSSPSTWASPTGGFGAFGNFSLGPTPTEPKSNFSSLRSESRFKNLLNKDSSDDKDKTSAPPQEGDEEQPSEWAGAGPVRTRVTRSETNPFGDEPRDSGQPDLGDSGIDQFGLSFGLPAGLRDLVGDPSEPINTGLGEPMSPTNTNPYQSPPQGQHNRGVGDDADSEGSDIQQHLPSFGQLRDEAGMASLGSLRRGPSAMGMSAGDRSQTSSTGPARSFSGLGGLNSLNTLGIGSPSGWAAPGVVGTPTRDRGFASGLNDPIFGSMAELQSPSLSTLPGAGFLGGPHSAGRVNKMASIFPTEMHMDRGVDSPIAAGPFDPGVLRSQAESRAGSLFSPLGGLDIGALARGGDAFLASTGAPHIPISASTSLPQTAIPPLADAPSQMHSPAPTGTPTAGPIPTHQRTMVMPDRMRWIYKDPQGNTQGPWSGLEMHDWFKAGFFTAELQIKKLEDANYEPLAQLVRRIGNSREPFLVPQIGVPHGSEPSQPSQWGQGSQSGIAQPPFANSFPTFGTTLTADQQNALERRKQEEQYLMARQKEHLAQQQALMKHMQLQSTPHPIHPQSLHHHSSAHSLHSQPSFGSVASPGSFQLPLMQGPIQTPQTAPGPFFDPRHPAPIPGIAPQIPPDVLANNQDELSGYLDRLNLSRVNQLPLPAVPFASRPENTLQHPISTMFQDRARLQQEQEQFDMAHGDSLDNVHEERLRQFQALRTDDEAAVSNENAPPEPSPAQPATQTPPTAPKAEEAKQRIAKEGKAKQSAPEPLSLTQQVQKAASAHRQQQQQQQQQQQAASPWNKIDTSVPFPPGPSQSPLPAPAAQRNRQNVADTLNANSRSQNHTPVEPNVPAIAPWAKDIAEAPKGPSLKEIQEAEARKAAKLEEVAAAARRAAAEQERSNQPPPPTPALPSTANWASAAQAQAQESHPSGSVWNKTSGNAAKGTGKKKTLAQIQKEEEARKQRLAATATANATANANAQAAMNSAATANASGKRYADLASKMASTSSNAGGGAWTTVGAGGKIKAPPAPPAAPAASRPSPAAAKPRVTTTVTTSRTATVTTTNPSHTATNTNRPVDELLKWTKGALGRGLNSSINVDDFVQQLLVLPTDTEIISDSVYANSPTLDGRRFAEEFVRRRRLADKGVVDPVVLAAGSNGFGATASDTGSSEGWSEVAKKGSANAHAQREREEGGVEFKVVPTKKKGRR